MRDQGHERLIGRTIAGKFVIEEFLGAGAMGAVFRARQSALEKTVAIKVLHPEHARDPTFAARFHREAKAASRLNHPNSMQVIDFGAEPDGLLYIAMEYLDGRSLFQLLRDQWPLAPARVADILMQTLAALAVAHDMGVVHRDLKPENIMVIRGTDDDGRPRDVVKVCDFGIAKINDPRGDPGGDRASAASVTAAGFLVGTPEYLSPEQGRGEKLDPRSDIYSVGVILFEMLTRRVPFDAENAIGVVLKHLSEAPPRPSAWVPDVDARLEAICLRALAKAPGDRFRGAREMRAELRPIAEGARASGAPAAAGLPSSPATHPARMAAPTVPMGPSTGRGAGPAIAGPGATALEVKPTLPGTSATIPGPPGQRAVFVAGAALMALVAAGTATAVVLTLARARPHAPAAVAAVAAPEQSETPGSQPTAQKEGLAPGAIADDDRVALSEAPSETAPAALGSSVASAVGAGHAHPSLPGALAASPASKPAQGGAPAASPAGGGVPSGVAPHGPASAATTALPSSVPTLPAPAPGPVIAPAPPAAVPAQVTEPPDPSFDPERGYIEIGLVNAQGAREGAVRVALRNAGMTRCYRSALRSRGARVTGTATLDLSFDGAGLARSAIVSGAEFLPGLTRCLQNACASTVLPRSHVDPGGATAEVFLQFKVPER